MAGEQQSWLTVLSCSPHSSEQIASSCFFSFWQMADAGSPEVHHTHAALACDRSVH
jgi:hypothetical protein|eukprot:COSAG06_NODE_324_length_17552_cov_11.946370_2_plen_56_part_00